MTRPLMGRVSVRWKMSASSLAPSLLPASPSPPPPAAAKDDASPEECWKFRTSRRLLLAMTTSVPLDEKKDHLMEEVI